MKLLWGGIYLTVLIWSVIEPKDYFTWVLEVTPALVGAVILLATYKKFPLTPLTYTLILIHCLILMVGGHYTYAEVPLFDWIKDIFELQRNDYDKVGHFAQGFIPAIITREILLRIVDVKSVGWVNFFSITTPLAISATYEIVEWQVALITGEAAEAFLGTQGYIWDTQSDMLWALIGAITAVATLSKIHSRQVEGMQQK